MLSTHFAAPEESLTIIIRPRCPKCKKEFMLKLNNCIPGRHHVCYACGTVMQFGGVLGERPRK
jgi:hypothetical protein